MSSILPLYKVQVTFPMWIVDNLDNEPDDQVIAQKLARVAMTYPTQMTKSFLRNAVFQIVENDDEEMDEETFDERVLFSGEYLDFLKTMMDNGLAPNLLDEED